MNTLNYAWIAAIAVLAGVGLWGLVAPASLVEASRKTAHSVHVPYGRWLDKTLYVDRLIYRFHRGVGLVVWLLSCLILYFVLFGVRGGAAGAIAGAQWQWLFEAVIVLATVAGVTGFCFGLVIMIRPSLIKPLEAWGNRWIHAGDRLDKEVSGVSVDAWVAGHTRLFSILVLLSSVLITWVAYGLDKG